MNIKYNEDMSKHTSFKTGGKADYYIVAKTEQDIKETLEFAKEKNIPIYIIGNGSNILVKDNGVRGIVLKIDLDEWNIDLENENGIIMAVGAGVKLIPFAIELEKREISGFEELSGIPGTFGGANTMNAGAYGKEMKDIIVETKCMDMEGNIFTLKNEEQKLSYRGSIFKNNQYIILQTKIKLQKGIKEEIHNKIEFYAKKRREKQPIEYPSAGSTFKRANGYITAELIDKCELKGFSIGGAQISEKHAGFIINKKNATSKDIIELIEYIKIKVFEKFNVQIEEEIEIIGE